MKKKKDKKPKYVKPVAGDLRIHGDDMPCAPAGSNWFPPCYIDTDIDPHIN